jgi:hypothetical protein
MLAVQFVNLGGALPSSQVLPCDLVGDWATPTEHLSALFSAPSAGIGVSWMIGVKL